MIAGLFGAYAIAAAMVRMRSDPAARGAEIDLSATEALFRMLDPLPVEHEVTGTVRAVAGNRATYTAPSYMYRSGDGVFVLLVASSDPVFARLARAIGTPALKEDPRYATMPARMANALALDALLHDWFAARSFADAAAALSAGDVPFSRVQSIADIVADPQFVAREAIVRLPDAQAGSLPAPCIVPRVVGERAPLLRTGPDVGEHNAQVFGELGLDAATLAMLRRERVI